MVSAAPVDPTPVEPVAAGVESPLLGFAINAHHIGDLSLYLGSVDAIADLGASGLLLVTPMFQKHADSNEIRYLPDKCPTDEQLLAILRRAERHGLQTTLLPIVLIEEPGPDDWRGLIRPADRAAWWASYDRFIDRYVDIAVAADVDVFSVGSELNSTEANVERWRGIIDRVRGRFDGRVTYTANWDRYDAVPFWPLVDFISISSYFELAPENPDASPERLGRAWRDQQRRLLRFARRYDQPFMLMELGYPSLPWAAAHPWNYVARDGVPADHEAQARCYRAFFEAWVETHARWPELALGFHCYFWDPYHHGEATDTGYGVAGKPAQEIIRDAFTRIRGQAAGDID
jgi:hypothetical protein